MKVAVMQLRRAPAEPPIPLDRPVKRELEEGDYLVYKLRNDPIPYFRDGTPEQFLRFRKNLQKVFKSQRKKGLENIIACFTAIMQPTTRTVVLPLRIRSKD
jgi:hypothetical protein